MTDRADDLKDRIRKRAYHLWEQDGRPHGRDLEFWERARELIAIEDNPTAGQEPNPMRETGREPGPPEPIESAQAAENQGTAPGRMTDQAEEPAVPSRRRRRKAGDPFAP